MAKYILKTHKNSLDEDLWEKCHTEWIIDMRCTGVIFYSMIIDFFIEHTIVFKLQKVSE